MKGFLRISQNSSRGLVPASYSGTACAVPWLALATAGLAACSEPVSDSKPPVETPIVDIAFGEPLVLQPQVIYDRGDRGVPGDPGVPDVEVGFVGALPTEAVALTLGKQLFTLAAGAGTPHELGADAGALHAVLPVGQGASAQLLVGGERGLFAVVAGILEHSPLAPAIGNVPVLGLLDSGTPDSPELWIITREAIHLWHQGIIRRVGVTTGAAGAPIEPMRSRFAVCRGSGANGWLVIVPETASSDVLVLPAAAVAEGMDTQVKLDTISVGHPIVALACDSRRVVTVATRDSLLVEIRLTSPRESAVSLGRVTRGVTWMVADPGAPDIWFGGADYVAHGRAGAYRVVQSDWAPFLGMGPDPSKPAIPPVLAADLGGPLLIAGGSHVGRVRAQATVEIKGLGDAGAMVDAPLQIDVSAPYPELIRSLGADLDGVAQWTDLASRHVVLNPWSVPPGPHTLRVTVNYSDGPALSAQAMVSIVAPAAPPGWAHDVEPIYSARCKKCHGPNGSGHLMDNAMRWQAQVVGILAAVNERRMPLPPNEPLSGLDVARIAGWKTTGFLP